MEKHIELGRGDLTLDCQAYVDSEGKEFVRVSITGRSETSIRIAPTLTATRNGNTVFSYTFVRAIDEDFGYTLDIPAERLLGGANGGEIVFTITDNDSGNEFADFDNQRSVTLGKTLVIIRQPEAQYMVEGQTATFYVIAEGTGLTISGTSTAIRARAGSRSTARPARAIPHPSSRRNTTDSSTAA